MAFSQTLREYLFQVFGTLQNIYRTSMHNQHFPVPLPNHIILIPYHAFVTQLKMIVTLLIITTDVDDELVSATF